MSFLGVPLRPPGTRPSTHVIARTSKIATWHTTGPAPHRDHVRDLPSRATYDTGRKGRCDVGKEVRALEDAFVSALAKAGSCGRQRTDTLQRRGWTRSSCAPRSQNTTTAQRQFSSTTARAEPFGVQLVWREEPTRQQQQLSKQEAKDLVNTYDESTNQLLSTTLRPLRLAPRLFLTAEQEEKASRTWCALDPENEDHRNQLQEFKRLLESRKPGFLNHDTLWAKWQALPSPRVRYSSRRMIRLLFDHLMVTEHKASPELMVRFVSLLDECASEGMHIKQTWIWNSAIAFAGRWSRAVTAAEIKSAVEMWMRMEDRGVKADVVTLNILFDVAARAGKFALAETIYNEVHARGLELNRYFRTSMIYYAGLRGDGPGVRRAFNELVDAGEIADTVVMNCVITSLIKAGEGPAAEHVFMKLKELHAAKMGVESPRRWQERRELGRTLERFSREFRQKKIEHGKSFFGGTFSQEDKREEVQRLSPIAPDTTTYRSLVKYHAATTGDIHAIQALLAEMKERSLYMHGSFYTHIIRGFEIHGGFPFTSWRRSLLEAIWEEFLTASIGTSQFKTPTHLRIDVDGATDSSTVSMPKIEIPAELVEGSIEQLDEDSDDDRLDCSSEEQQAPYFTRGLAKAALRSFYKCAGRARMLEVWDEIQTSWTDMSKEDRADLQRSVDWMVNRDNAYV